MILGLILIISFITNINALPSIQSINSDKIINEAEGSITAKWQYLSQEWPKIILKNKYIAPIDSFFHTISPLFFILFAKEYSLSLTLIITIVLWFYFLFFFYEIFKDFSSFSKSVSLGISFLMIIIIAHLKILENISYFFIKLAFGERVWYYSIIIWLVIIIILVIAYKLEKITGKSIRERREEMKKIMKEAEEKSILEQNKTFAKAMQKSFSTKK